LRENILELFDEGIMLINFRESWLGLSMLRKSVTWVLFSWN